MSQLCEVAERDDVVEMKNKIIARLVMYCLLTEPAMSITIAAALQFMHVYNGQEESWI